MAEKKANKATNAEPTATTDAGAGVHEAKPIAEADDGNESRLTKGYEDNPDVPEASVAQVEVLKD